MKCDYFGKCGSCTLYDMSYEEQLEHKTKKIKSSFNLDSFDILTSPSEHFRSRAEFRIYHDDNGISYAMNTMSKKGVIKIDSCSIVSPIIDSTMKTLLKSIKNIDILTHKLFSVEFLSSSTNEIIATLIYHKKIDDEWKNQAQKIAHDLNIEIIGRSRKVKIVVTKDNILEKLEILGKTYKYRLYDIGFTQPNVMVNQKMIGWVKKQIPTQNSDLLELYCGHGNFTIALSENFNKVLATEISKNSIKAAKENCELNNITNITFVRLSSEELTTALNKEREFNRLRGIDLDAFNFSHVFVDPPRAGLDAKSIRFIKKFNNIIYISCNPETLKRDLEILKADFTMINFAIFDQFAYTNHIECGVILQSKG
jgi:tRNA (uracil-5-)-methyltransferase